MNCCVLFSLSLPLSRSGLDDHSTPFIFRSKRHYTLFICREWFICRNYFRLLQHTWFVLIASGRLPFDLHLINLQVCCLSKFHFIEWINRINKTLTCSFFFQLKKVFLFHCAYSVAICPLMMIAYEVLVFFLLMNK